MTNTPHHNLRAGSLPGQLNALTVAELAERLKSGEPPLVLDIREHEEVAHCPLPVQPLKHIQMREVLSRMAELPKDKLIAVICRSGFRSTTITKLLKANGFMAANVDGGVYAWRERIDPTLPHP